MEKKAFFVYHLLSLLPKGKVLTYGQIARFLEIKSPRYVGRILHQNLNPEKNPCHRVVFADGSLSEKYAFGGKKAQRKKLEEEGVVFSSFLKGKRLEKKVNLKISGFSLTSVLKLYFFLLKKFGQPGPWPWFQEGPAVSAEEIVLGAVLTQGTNWQNVEKALENLRKAKANSLLAVYELGKKDIQKLARLIYPSGFYRQKAKRLFLLAQFFVENYHSLENFFKLNLYEARKKLLLIKGIGEETADTILLYAGNKPIFVVDAYTFCFAQKYFSQKVFSSYHLLQKYFQDRLPLNFQLFQNYHALIVRWGKELRKKKKSFRKF